MKYIKRISRVPIFLQHSVQNGICRAMLSNLSYFSLLCDLRFPIRLAVDLMSVYPSAQLIRQPVFGKASLWKSNSVKFWWRHQQGNDIMARKRNLSVLTWAIRSDWTVCSRVRRSIDPNPAEADLSHRWTRRSDSCDENRRSDGMMMVMICNVHACGHVPELIWHFRLFIQFSFTPLIFSVRLLFRWCLTHLLQVELLRVLEF